ncbi:M28 family peptidase [Danxiaibacter flavus]|uniref:M28 family peptidase n=1 Tax=Danxiaibacter flavus TaxID=3049108 RepID=A0ABV3ZAV8_9BACT|nr:M28 family peptidase [Chitinophagaceae bacterium DXS]
MMKKVLIFALLCFIVCGVHADDSTYARKIVDTLTSAAYWGRGYTKNGMSKAADFLQRQFKTIGLRPLNGEEYTQSFAFPVNTFPGKMKVKLNGKRLYAGKDFIVSPDSKGTKAKGRLTATDSIHFFDTSKKIEVILANKLTWSVAHKESNQTTIIIDKNRVRRIPGKIKTDIQNELVSDFTAANVCGFVKGTEQPDSIIFITAHYDHLGGMGNNVFFPGANDNASGVSLLLTLANYYAAHPQKYSIGFICFAAEEAGLIGSRYFVENPLVSLDKIRFVVNLDLLGTGEKGITVVNATEYPEAFTALQNINNSQKLVPEIKSRGKAANSDHYWFSEAGVPAFFMYTMGGPTAYHDVFDVSHALPMNSINSMSELIKGFVGYLNK